MVHPQFWPEDLEYAGKRVVVIGSGATAVTLVPAMAERRGPRDHAAAQPELDRRDPGAATRSPTGSARSCRPRLAHRLIRTQEHRCSRWASTTSASASRIAPAGVLLGLTTRRSSGTPRWSTEHFTPSYDPWDQRFCAVPDADLFRCIQRGDAEVVTDHIDAFVPEGIRLKSGRVLEADVVVTATGLKLQPFGGIAPSVDGETVDLHEQFVWQGAMITGMPNFAVCIGYTNASWTLRADLTHRLVCRVLNHLDAARLRGRGAAAATASSRSARCSTSARATSSARSTQFPRQGDRGPWRVRQNYLLDSADHDAPRPARVDGVHAAVRRTHSRRAARGRRV